MNKVSLWLYSIYANPCLKCGDHRIIELFRLEKTFKIFQSNRQPNTTVPTKPCPEVPRPYIFLIPPGMVTLTMNEHCLLSSRKTIINYTGNSLPFTVSYFKYVHITFLITFIVNYIFVLQKLIYFSLGFLFPICNFW